MGLEAAAAAEKELGVREVAPVLLALAVATTEAGEVAAPLAEAATVTVCRRASMLAAPGCQSAAALLRSLDNSCT